MLAQDDGFDATDSITICAFIVLNIFLTLFNIVFGWMFFLKIFDDREKELELIRDSYRSPLPQHLRWSAWATDAEGITGDALLDFVNNTLLPKLKSLTGGADKIASLILQTIATVPLK